MRWRNRKEVSGDELTRLRALVPQELFSLGENPTVEELKAAYRRMVKVYHPDKADPFMKRHNEEVIKIINQAYDHLLAELEPNE